MIKPRSVEYLQKRHNKSKGHGHGGGGNLSQSTAKPGTGTGRGRSTPTTGSKCPSCGRVHGENVCPAKNSVCFGCNKKGHFKMMCYSSRRTQSWSCSSSQQNKAV